MTNNHTSVTNVNVDLSVLLQHVHNNVSVVNVDQTVTNVSIVDASTTTTTNVNILAPIASNAFTGCTDPDAGFFLRTQHAGKPLVHTAQDANGQRFLVGNNIDGKAAAPKNAQLFLYHPETQAKIAVQTDAKGCFAAPLPAGVSGRVYLYAEGSGAAALDV